LNALDQISSSRAYLQKAYDETVRKANLIADPQHRRDFLRNISLNQAIISLMGQA